MRSTLPVDPALRLAVLLGASLTVFTLWPGLDLWVSGLFYVPGEGFAMARSGVLEAVRVAIRWSTVTLFFVALFAWPATAVLRRPAVPGRVWGVIAGVYLLGPGLLVNGVLKEWWGRARPAQVQPFGGDRTFTPAWRITDQCATNCSFVSGEGAGAAAFAVAVVLLAPALPHRWRRLSVAVAVAVAALGGALRVVTGRHFASDTVIAVLMVALIATLLSRALPPDWRPLAALRRRGGDPGRI